MFKRTIKFETLDGEEKTREFYFHISKSELMAMANDADSMQERIKRIQATNDVRAVIEEFRSLIRMSVGIRSEDGERFIKTPEAQSYLLDSPAFDELLFDLISKPDAAVEFIKQLVPQKLQDDLQKELEKQKAVADPLREPSDPRPNYQVEHRKPTPTELQKMTKEELQEAWSWTIENGLA